MGACLGYEPGTSCKITKLNSMANPSKRLDLLTRLGHGKGHKNKTTRNKNEDKGRKKNGKVF